MNPIEQIQGGDPMSQMSQQPPQGGMQQMPEERKQELLAMIEKIKQGLESFKIYRSASKGKSDQMRSDVLKEVFEKLQMAGVDLTDRESVAKFIDKLRQSNPELADMFEQAMDRLLGGEMEQDPNISQDPNMMGPGMPPQNNMNINPNETSTQNIPQGL
jgi:hypothetical protein